METNLLSYDCTEYKNINLFSHEYTDYLYVPDSMEGFIGICYAILAYKADKEGKLKFKNIDELIKVFNCPGSNPEELKQYIEELVQNKSISIEEDTETQEKVLKIAQYVLMPASILDNI